MKLHKLICTFFMAFLPLHARAAELKVGDMAPAFSLKNQDGGDFSLESRKGAGWTVLYFYPKADTPGCTRQACAFRDTISELRALGAEVFGVSADDAAAVKRFHEEQRLSFDLLADPEFRVISLYGAKMPVLPMAKRWTFLIDPELVIRAIDHDVDPVMDAKKVAAKLKELGAR